MLNRKNLKQKVSSFVPYLSTFYYVEIIYLMIFINFLYGKIFAIAAGSVLTVFLTFHVIRLFYKKDINRKIQLYLMDLHFAWSLAYLFNRIFSKVDLSFVDSAAIAFRLMMASAEILTVLILTDRIVMDDYND